MIAFGNESSSSLFRDREELSLPYRVPMTSNDSRGHRKGLHFLPSRPVCSNREVILKFRRNFD